MEPEFFQYDLGQKHDRKRPAITKTAGLLFLPSRLIGKPDHLGLDLAHLLQFFPYVFYLLLLPGLDEFYFLLCIIELDMRIHIEGDGNVAVPIRYWSVLALTPERAILMVIVNLHAWAEDTVQC